MTGAESLDFARESIYLLLEMMDMREAQRSYEANLQVMDGARNMLTRTIDLLRR